MLGGGLASHYRTPTASTLSRQRLILEAFGDDHRDHHRYLCTYRDAKSRSAYSAISKACDFSRGLDRVGFDAPSMTLGRPLVSPDLRGYWPGFPRPSHGSPVAAQLVRDPGKPSPGPASHLRN
jgi:hypothetical protein